MTNSAIRQTKMKQRQAKVWFITGAARGFGRQWTTAALQRGDKVAATARDIGMLDDLRDEFADLLFRIRLDVTDRSEAFSAVRTAHEHFRQLDIVVNNAGYGLRCRSCAANTAATSSRSSVPRIKVGAGGSF
jgi:NADP-dependent 3-hydroxy acid dehydrogenase YdfG